MNITNSHHMFYAYISHRDLPPLSDLMKVYDLIWSTCMCNNLSQFTLKRLQQSNILC